MIVRLLAFAAARDVIGAEEIAFDVDAPASAQSLLSAVCARWPALAPYRASLRVAVNGAYAAWDDEVRAGDEVAIIPPVAGG